MCVENRKVESFSSSQRLIRELTVVCVCVWFIRCGDNQRMQNSFVKRQTPGLRTSVDVSLDHTWNIFKLY